MKKYFAIIVCVLASLTAQAQREPGTFSLTPKVGINISTFSGDDNEGTKSKFGFTGGAEGTYQANNHLALSAGIIYSQQGTKIDATGNVDIAYNMDYINVPLLVNYYVSEGFALKAGIQIGLLANAKFSANEDNSSFNYDIKKGCNTVDVTIPIGASYEFGKFVLDARYNLGTTKVFGDLNQVAKQSEFQIPVDPDLYNSSFSFTLGYRFDL